MKKLLKYSLFLNFSFLSTSFIVSCKSSENYNKNDYSPYKDLIEENVILNDQIKSFTNKHFFKGDDKNIREFFTQQIRVEKKFKNELNISLTFAPLFIPNILNIASEFQLKHAINSVDVISDTLTQRWFWYIQNIKNFSYVFNNWRSDFKDYKNSEGQNDNSDREIFTKIYDDKEKLFRSFKNYEIKEFSPEIKIENIKTDKLFDLQIVFLRMENQDKNNILIPIFLYKKAKNGDVKISITGEIFSFKNKIDIWNNEIYNKLANYISEGRKYFAQKTVDYQRKLFESENKNGLEKFDETKFLIDYNDVNFIKHYDKNNYTNSFYYAINKYNDEKNQENKIYRYSWGFINEK
ncbi:aromatic motif membrane protein [Mesomycoplasma molare]|uniref:Lipoprotein n=1 Tax=Mesomycoplasma molare TaxID=171288 RepID=A0ABY5TX55_9BACT|nr:aromatic motif membrane protein [Mesomycoplasma molare]UWD34576.1 hypothetical protein NX772_01975 [Mesomycoplasma molare]